MAEFTVCTLSDRGVVRLIGDDVEPLLQRLITTDMDQVSPENAGFGALLTPQGKILFDFLIIGDRNGGYWVDMPRPIVADFIKRMALYKLRADVTLTDCSTSHQVCVSPTREDLGREDLRDTSTVTFADPRSPALGFRAIVEGQADTPPDALEAWHNHRIALGIPEVFSDFGYGDLFPHDVAMDHLNGLVFDKGCYVGQEVVSRMEHRGTARKRPVVLSGTGLEGRATLSSGGKTIGTTGLTDGNKAIAIVRLDRLPDSTDTETALTCNDVPVTADLPDWAGYGRPE